MSSFGKITTLWAAIIVVGLLVVVGGQPPTPKSEAAVVYKQFESAVRAGQEESCGQTAKWRREHGRICVGKPSW